MSDEAIPVVAQTEGDPARDLAHDPAPIAQRALEEFLEKMQVKANVVTTWGMLDPEDNSRPLVLDVQGDDLGLLIGRQGETLNAIQHLLRLMLSKHIHPDTNLIVDVQGHKSRREEQLRRLAQRLAEQAVQRQRIMSLEPMPAHERRIVHLELRQHPGVRTESAGEGNKRKVTIIPK